LKVRTVEGFMDQFYV